jgi:DNA polymerase-3 subunit alpha
MDGNVATGTSAIRFGLGAVKNVGEGALQGMLQARADGGPFAGAVDFCRRVDLRAVNKRALECLIKVGTLDSLGDRPKLLVIIDRMMGLSQLHHQAAAVGQLTLDGMHSDTSDDRDLISDQVAGPPVSQKEMLAWEKELLGVYVSEHPLQRLLQSTSRDYTLLDRIDDSLKGRKVTIAGIVTRLRLTTTRKDEEMAFVEMEDLNSSVDVVVFPRTYNKYKELLAEDRLLVIEGRVDLRNGEVQIICDSVQDYALADIAEKSAPVRVRLLEVNLHCSGNRDRDMNLWRRTYEILEQRKGSDRFRFNIISDQGCVQLEFPNVTTHCESELEGLLKETLGENALHVRWTEA